MIKNPLISIIIPYYNGKAYLNDLKECLINQSYKNFEVLIVDDFSNDSSLEIIEELTKTDSRFKLIKMPYKGGFGCKGLEEGLKHINGDYFFIITQDDFIDLDYLEKCVDIINKTSAEIVLSRAVFYKEKKSKTIGKFFKKLNSKKAFQYSLDWKICNVGIRSTKLLEKIPFKADYYNSDEFLFRKYLLLTEEIYFADTKFYYRTDNESALTKTIKFFNFDLLTTDILLAKCLLEYKYPKRKVSKRFFKLIKYYPEWIKLYNANKTTFSEKETEYIINTLKAAKNSIEEVVQENNLFSCKLELFFNKLEEPECHKTL